MRTAALRYRVMAYITGVLIIVVCFVGIPLQLAAHDPCIANNVGTVHGFLYIVYVVFAYILAQKLKMKLLADHPAAAGRHGPDHDVLRRAVDEPGVHRPRAGRRVRPVAAAARGPVSPARHYFTAQPSAAHRPGLVRVVLPDLYLELATDSGVFSPGRLDPGTRLLLEEAPAPPPVRGHPRPGLRLRPDRVRARGPRARRDGLGG